MDFHHLSSTLPLKKTKLNENFWLWAIFVAITGSQMDQWIRQTNPIEVNAWKMGKSPSPNTHSVLNTSWVVLSLKYNKISFSKGFLQWNLVEVILNK